MRLWILFAIALLLFALGFRESFTDPEFRVTRPSMDDATWRSKIDAEAPIGGNDEDYMRVLQAFYDKVYVPSAVKPKDTDVEAFLKTPDATVPGVDPISLRKILSKAFHVEVTTTAAAREQAQIATTGALAGFSGTNLQPGNARDEVYTRDELAYIPADSRKGDLPEGLYEPTQQYKPRRPGDYKDKSTSWTQVSPMSFCEEGDVECLKNVL